MELRERLYRRIEKVDDERVLEAIEVLLQQREAERAHAPMSAEAYSRGLTEAYEEYKGGEYTTLEQLDEDVERWLTCPE